MASSNRLIHTTITCHNKKITTTAFNEDATIDEIHSHVRDIFGSCLPASYHLTMYDADTAGFIIINQNQLDYERNPFRSNSFTNNQQNESMLRLVSLYIVNASPVIVESSIQTSISSQNIILSEHKYSSTLSMSEQECQQDVPICVSAPHDNISNSGDLSNALLTKDISDIDVFVNHLFASDNEHASAAYSIENQSDLDPVVDQIFLDAHNSSGALLLEESQVPVPVMDDNPLERITIGNAMPSRNEIQITESDRLYFSLDVKPDQKDIYKSDQINQKTETKNNGYVARIQGIKTPAQKMSSVWPKLRITRSYRRKHNVRVGVYVVLEKRENGMRIWSKHRSKGFLPKGFTRNTAPINPIEFDSTEWDLTAAGDFELDLQMTTMWDKSLMVDEEVYRLGEDIAFNLHPAEYDPLTPRLLCVLQEGTFIDWNTFCLSDFIRSPKRGLSSTTKTGQTNGSSCKRARIN